MPAKSRRNIRHQASKRQSLPNANLLEERPQRRFINFDYEIGYSSQPAQAGFVAQPPGAILIASQLIEIVQVSLLVAQLAPGLALGLMDAAQRVPIIGN